MKELSIGSKEDKCSHSKLRLIQKFSTLAKKVYCYKCKSIIILKNYKSIFNDFCVFNECFYYEITDLILNKAGIRNNIPKRRILTPTITITNDEFVTKDKESDVIIIEGFSCAIDYIGDHARVTKKNMVNYKKEKWPCWIYWIDVWLGRLDCSGDTNLLICNDEMIPIDFNIIGTWSAILHPYFINTENIEIDHFVAITENKNNKILEIISDIKDEEIIELFYNINQGLISKDQEDLYISGLIKRREILKLLIK